MKIHSGTLTLGYDDHGSGRPLVLVHGYPHNRSLWAEQSQALSDAARVLAVDLRGHGESDAPDGPYSMDVFADDCAHLLDVLGIHQPVVFGGLSMGGYVTLAFWRRYPTRVAGLMLAATSAGADSAEARAAREASMETVKKEGPGAIVDAMLRKSLAPDTPERYPHVLTQARAVMSGATETAILGDLAGLRDRPDSTGTLSTITVPTLVVHGAQDQLIPPAEAERTAAGITNAQLALIAGAGHLPNLEQPDAFNTVVREFLNRI